MKLHLGYCSKMNGFIKNIYKKISKAFVSSLISALLFVNNPVYPNDTILSKEHAASIFSMSKTRWNSSAIKIAESGQAKASTNSHGVERMQLRYGTGAYLYVVPEFLSVNHKPSSIHVTLAMPPPMSLMFDTETIQTIITQVKSQMLPEYQISANYESVGGGVALFFIIVED